MTECKSTPWLQEAIKKHKKNGQTPKFTIQGLQTDKNSDFYVKNKNSSAKVICINCVLTGDIPLIALDSGGELVQDSVSFGAYDIV